MIIIEATVTVANGTPLTESNDEAIITVTFTNTNDFTYVAGNIYFTALLTDSTTPTAQTQTVTFTLVEATGGTMTGGTSNKFTMTNTESLTGTLTPSNGAIYYPAS